MVRNDVTVNWSVSPRVITVAAPSVEISCQDLYDTIRTLAALAPGMDDPEIIDAGGKEDLGGGVQVGLTVTLYDAKLAFEARLGPDFIQCRVAGGNLVALDANGDSMSPIHPTAYTQIILASSSSATAIQQPLLEYSSFGNGVSIDITSPYSGTVFPIGTPLAPVNNLADAHMIAIERGFTTFYIIGNLTIGAGDVHSGHTFIGESQTKTIITIDTAAQVLGVEFQDATLTGILDGDSRAIGCRVFDLNYITGYIERCILDGTITLGGATHAHFLDCWTGAPSGVEATIDLGGSNAPGATIRNLNGRIKLRNQTVAADVSIDLASGLVEIDNTVTAGTIIVRGVGRIVNNSVGTTVVTTELFNPLDLILARKILQNRYVANDSNGRAELYNDINELEYQANIYEDAGGTTPFGQDSAKINRRDRFEPV